MPRQRAYDKDEVIDRAVDLFWQRGYGATSIQELVEATGINRASMYSAFGNKAGLFNAALDRYLRSDVTSRILEADERQPFPALMAGIFSSIIDQAVQGSSRRGCLLTNTAVELSPHDDAVAEKIKRELSTLESGMTKRIERAQARGEVTEDVDPSSLARAMINTIQGLRVIAKVNPDREVLSDIAGMALRQLID